MLETLTENFQALSARLARSSSPSPGGKCDLAGGVLPCTRVARRGRRGDARACQLGLWTRDQRGPPSRIRPRGGTLCRTSRTGPSPGPGPGARAGSSSVLGALMTRGDSL